MLGKIPNCKIKRNRRAHRDPNVGDQRRKRLVKGTNQITRFEVDSSEIRQSPPTELIVNVLQTDSDRAARLHVSGLEGTIYAYVFSTNLDGFIQY